MPSVFPMHVDRISLRRQQGDYGVVQTLPGAVPREIPLSAARA
jgi:hypothetical protein